MTDNAMNALTAKLVYGPDATSHDKLLVCAAILLDFLLCETKVHT